MKLNLLSSVFVGALLLPGLGVSAGHSSQVIHLKHAVGIPGGTLQPGTFTFAIEDHLSDRTIVRVTSPSNSKHYLLLAVPAENQDQADASGLTYFSSGNGGDQSVKSWKCPSCSSAIEFVYPKLQAVKITDGSAQPVLAVDPASDKLPENLSTDDMKVVTLWTLSPERINGNTGEGVKAAKYTASNSASASQETATATAPPTPAAAKARMPKTASNTFSLALYGMILLAGAITLRLTNARRS